MSVLFTSSFLRSRVASSFFVFITSLFILGTGSSVLAEGPVCRFTCLEYANVQSLCTDYARRPGPAYIYFQTNRDQAFDSASLCSASTNGCQDACIRTCNGGTITNGSDALPTDGGRPFCILGGPPSNGAGPMYTGILACPGGYSGSGPTPVTRSDAWTAPHCEAAAVAPSSGPSGSACTTPAPAIPANAAPKRCSFSCIQTGLGANDTSVDDAGNTCSSARLIPHTGRVACSAAGECACIDECKSTCGAVGGKSLCFLGPGNPDQVNICHGATGIAQAHAPTCSADAAAAGSPTTLTNPLNTTDIGELIARFIRAITGIAGSMALLMMVVGGVIWMTAEGSDRVQVGQTIIKNSFLGIILIFFAFSLVSLFLAVLGV